MAHEKLKPEYTFTEDKINALKKIVPEVFEDGKINFDTLRECFGEWVEEDDDERFGLIWPGKKEARRLAAIPSNGTLIPVYGEGLKADGTPDDDGFNDSSNIFIEGENLEVLKILQKSYAGRVKMIYIDPPYNTGNDYIYDDDFTDPLRQYLIQTGQIDEEGNPTTTNKKSDGRYHSRWLNMVVPRFIIARSLLKDDGFIYVSVDDNEVSNLKLVLNELFGEENFRGQIARLTGTPTGLGAGRIVNEFDYLLVYSKSELSEFKGLPLSEEDEQIYTEVNEHGRYLIRPLRKTGGEDRREDRPTMYYAIESPDSDDIYPIGPGGYKSRWRCSRSTYDEYMSSNRIEWKQVEVEGTLVWRPYLRFYLEGRTKQPSNLWDDIEGNKKATTDLKKLMGGKVFDNPKPVGLIERILEITANPDDLVLDFFAGSCTLGHSVLQFNSKHSSRLKYICVQIPSEVDRAHEAWKLGYKNIAEIAVNRLRAAGELYNVEDRGVRVFNYRQAQLDLKTVDEQLFKFKETSYEKKALIYEIMLLEGYPLHAKVKQIKDISCNKVNSITSDYHVTKLLICLDDKISTELLNDMKFEPNDVFICFDYALQDQNKLRLSDRGIIKTIG